MPNDYPRHPLLPTFRFLTRLLTFATLFFLEHARRGDASISYSSLLGFVGLRLPHDNIYHSENLIDRSPPTTEPQ